MANPFDFMNSICDTKVDLFEEGRTDYLPFIMNKSLSYHLDTVLLANEMNGYHELDGQLQYDFLLNSVRKRRRHAKWAKRDEVEAEALDAICWRYKMSRAKAMEVIQFFTHDQIAEMKQQKGNDD